MAITQGISRGPDKHKRTIFHGRNDQVHRAMAQVGEPITSVDLAALLEIKTDVARQTMVRLVDKGIARIERVTPRFGGNPTVTYVLTEDGLSSVPDPTPHSLVGHSAHSPSLRPGDGTDFRNQPWVAPGGPVTRTAGVKMSMSTTKALSATTWPMLQALRGRLASQAPLRAAAEALPQGDPLRKSIEERLGTGGLTDVEIEYLTYADTHK